MSKGYKAQVGGGYPSTPWDISNFIFKNRFQNPTFAQDNTHIYSVGTDTAPICQNPTTGTPGNKICTKGHQFDVSNVEVDLKVGCPNTTKLLLYGKSLPASIVQTWVGTMVNLRMTNAITVDEGIGVKQFEPCDTNATNVDPYGRDRKGVPFSMHHHGSASMAPYDGWAEDETCSGEVKDYMFPANRAATEWYHDHALDITGRNANFGMAGMFLVREGKPTGSIDPGTGQPGSTGDRWDLSGLEELYIMNSDKVLRDNCQIRYDVEKGGVHFDQYYGDINIVSGNAFPAKDDLQAKPYRIRLLTHSVTRAFLIDLVEYDWNTHTTISWGSKICTMIASDGGYRKTVVPFPDSPGLWSGVAERYEFVCDFSDQRVSGKTLYFWNNRDTDRQTSDYPFFCYSHLLMRLFVNPAAQPTNYPPKGKLTWSPNDPSTGKPWSTETVIEDVIPSADIAAAVDRFKTAGFGNNTAACQRYFEFGKSGDSWVVNGETWHTHRIAAADVGTNTWEVWCLKNGGGWFHPIHIHLVDFQVIYRASNQGGTALQPFESDVPKDVVALHPSANIGLLMRFGAHRGEYMFHCHNLVHEDRAMLRSFVGNTDKTAATAQALLPAGTENFVTPTGNLADMTHTMFVGTDLNGNAVLYDTYENPTHPLYMAKSPGFGGVKDATGATIPFSQFMTWDDTIKHLLTINPYRMFYPWAANIPVAEQTLMCSAANVWKVKANGLATTLCAAVAR